MVIWLQWQGIVPVLVTWSHHTDLLPCPGPSVCLRSPPSAALAKPLHKMKGGVRGAPWHFGTPPLQRLGAMHTAHPPKIGPECLYVHPGSWMCLLLCSLLIHDKTSRCWAGHHGGRAWWNRAKLDGAVLCYLHSHWQWYQEVPVSSHIWLHRHTIGGDAEEDC